MSAANPNFETIALHGGQVADSDTKSRAVPIYQTTSYVFDSAEHGAALFNLSVPGNIYTRIMNPTQAVLETRVAQLEGGLAGLAVASGQAAITLTLTTLLRGGDHIVAGDNLYGGTYNLLHHTLPRTGIDTTFVDSKTPEAFRAAIKPETSAIYIEALGPSWTCRSSRPSRPSRRLRASPSSWTTPCPAPTC